MRKQRFELIAGKSAKFWEVHVKGSTMTTAYGRIGTKGQSNTKKYASASKAKDATEKLIKQKIDKGYIRSGTAENSNPVAPKSRRIGTVDYAQLDEMIAQRLSKEANKAWGRKQEKVLAAVLSPWGAFIPVARWWDPKKFTPRKIQALWRKLYGNKAANFIEMMRQTPAINDDLLQVNFIDSGLCTKRYLADLAHCKSIKVRTAVARNRKSPAAVLKQLTASMSFEVADAAIGNPSCPADVLKTLASSPNSGVRATVAANSNCPPRVIMKLATDDDRWVRESALSNRRLPTSAHRKQATSRVAAVRANWAASELCAPRTLSELALDKSRRVRLAVATNEKTRAKSLEHLAKDKTWRIREAVAWNSRTPVHSLEYLAGDKNEQVRLGVAWDPRITVRCIEKLAVDRTRAVRMAIAHHSKLPIRCLRQLAKDQSYADKRGSIRQVIASRDKCPSDILEQMYMTWKDHPSEWRLPEIIVDNANCSTDLLERIADIDSSNSVRRLAKNRLKERKAESPIGNRGLGKASEVGISKNQSANERESYMAELMFSYLSGQKPIAQPAATDDYLHVFEILELLSRGAKSQQISGAARSKDTLKRMAAAMHPTVTTATLERLAGDHDSMIREEALRRLDKQS